METERTEFVVFKRDELEQFFGEVALPPGSGAPLNTPCVPIVQKIGTWIEENEIPTPEAYLLLKKEIHDQIANIEQRIYHPD